MKRTINITEEDIIKIAQQVISEQFDDKKDKTKKPTKRNIKKQGKKRQTANIQKYLTKLDDFDMNLKEAMKLHSKGGEENDVHAMLLLIEGIIKAETLAVAAAVIQQLGHFSKMRFNQLMSERTFGGRIDKLMASIKYLRKERNDVGKYVKPIKRKVDNVEKLIETIAKTGDLPEGSRTADEFMYHIEQLKNFTTTVYSYLEGYL